MTPHTPVAAPGGSHPPVAEESGGLRPPLARTDEAPLARALRILAGDIRPDDYLPVPDEIRADDSTPHTVTVCSYATSGDGPQGYTRPVSRL